MVASHYLDRVSKCHRRAIRPVSDNADRLVGRLFFNIRLIVLFMLDMKLLKSTRPSGIRQAILVVFAWYRLLIDQTLDLRIVEP